MLPGSVLMGNEQRQTRSGGADNRGRRVIVIGALAILLVVVTVIVLQTIERAPAAGAGGPGGGGGPPGMPPAAVLVQAVKSEVTQAEERVTGTLKAVAQARVAAREPGAVSEVLIREGDTVVAGAPLARLDARRTTALLAEAEARLVAARNLLEQRQAELRRAETDATMKRGLRERQAVSQSDLLDAEKLLAVATAQRDAAIVGIKEMESRIDLLKVQLTDLTVTAPFAGTVVERRVEAGEWLGAGAVVASLVTLDPIEAWLRVPARHLAGTELEAATFRVRQSATGREFTPAKVEKIPQVEPLSQLFVVVATVPNPRRELTPGESVTGVVPVGKRQPYWRIPVNAVVQTPTGRFAYVVRQPEGEGPPIARRVAVDVAFERDGAAYVAATADGFKEGDLVVVEGNERLLPGQPLLVKPAGDGAVPAAP